jgi:hypothetical protein
VPSSVSVAEASDAGVGSIEHMLQIPVSCTPAESVALVPRFPVQRVVGRCSSQDLAPLFARLVQNNTWVVPTLVASYEVAHWPKSDCRAMPTRSTSPIRSRNTWLRSFLSYRTSRRTPISWGCSSCRKRLALVRRCFMRGRGSCPEQTPRSGTVPRVRAP